MRGGKDRKTGRQEDRKTGRQPPSLTVTARLRASFVHHQDPRSHSLWPLLFGGGVVHYNVERARKAKGKSEDHLWLRRDMVRCIYTQRFVWNRQQNQWKAEKSRWTTEVKKKPLKMSFTATLISVYFSAIQEELGQILTWAGDITAYPLQLKSGNSPGLKPKRTGLAFGVVPSSTSNFRWCKVGK